MSTDQDTAVWASFVYLRSGESTPLALQNTSPELTPLGANQLQSAGQFFRTLYLQDGSSSRIAALDASQPLAAEVSALTLADPVTSASTQAFMLGMWPPNSTISSSSADISSTLANGTTLGNPLGGIRFPAITAVSQNDMASIYVAGDMSCNGFATFSQQINPAANLVQGEQQSRAAYTAVQDILIPVFTESQQTFDNAKNIYDYVNYQNTHNKTAAAQLATQPSLVANLRYYAALQQTALYGDPNAGNPYDRAPLAAKVGSISTIAGASLASQIGISLYAQSYSIRSAHPLSIIVGDHGPLTSLFPLLNLTNAGLALPGSAAVFELISPSSTTSRTENGIPAPSDLAVRFRFRNGTGLDPGLASGGELVPLPLFNHSAAMPYTDFLSALSTVAIAGPQDWCQQCGADALFCAPWNASLSYLPSTPSHSRRGISPAAAGAIGAVTPLLLALLIVALLSLLGLRPSLTRSRRYEPGGFKRGLKLGSDPDLARPMVAHDKYSPVIGASLGVEKPSPIASLHSRAGSWELAESPSPRGRDNNVFSFACAGVGGQKRFVRDSRAESVVMSRDFGGLGGLDGARMGWGSREDVTRGAGRDSFRNSGLVMPPRGDGGRF